MRFQWLTRLSGRTPTPPGQLVACAAVVGQREMSAPHGASVLAVRSPQAILEAHADLLRRLRLHAACEEARFSLRFVAPLHRLARHVNVLPASESGLFCGCMGLFRACLESAFFCFQAADGRIFTGSEGVERRHALEWRWRYLCFLAGMFHPAGRPLQRLVLLQAEAQDWKQAAGGVTAWAEASGIDHLIVAWDSDCEGEAIGPAAITLPLLPQVVGRENLTALEDGADDLLASLCELAAGQPGKSSMAHETIRNCWQRITEREAGPPLQGTAGAGGCAAPVAAPAPCAALRAASMSLNSTGSRPPESHASAPASYADLVPADLREEIAASLHAEGLGKIVHAWRQRAEGSTVMRRIDSGAAIEFAFLASAVTNVPIWLDAMVRCGLVHAPAHTPGQRIQKVAMAEGQPPVQALVLSNLACRRLGL
jgi:conjugal transfer pilus assembly protein TraI